MPSVTGTILLVQESRLRLLTDDHRGLIFLLGHDAPIEPQDLPALTGARVRLDYVGSDRLAAGVIKDLRVLGETQA